MRSRYYHLGLCKCTLWYSNNRIACWHISYPSLLLNACGCTGLPWNGARYSPLPSLFGWQGFWLSGQGTNSVTHPAGTQTFVAKSLVLPRPVFSCGTSSLLPGLQQWIPHCPLPHLPHCCKIQLLTKKTRSQCSPAQNPLVAPIDLVLFAKSGPLLRISGAQWTLTQKGKKSTQCLKPFPTLRITWTLSLHWFSQLALVSASFTSYCLLFLSSCFGHIEIAVPHTLSAVSCSCAFSCCLFLCLE